MRATWFLRFAFGGLAAVAIAQGWQGGARFRLASAAPAEAEEGEGEATEDASSEEAEDAPGPLAREYERLFGDADEAPETEFRFIKQGPAFQPRRSNQPTRTTAPLDLSEDAATTEPSIEERFASLVETDGKIDLALSLAGTAFDKDLDIFVEGDDFAYFREPRPAGGEGLVYLRVDGLKDAKKLKGRRLTLTMTAGDIRLEQDVVVD